MPRPDEETALAIYHNPNKLSAQERARKYNISLHVVYKIDRGDHWINKLHNLPKKQPTADMQRKELKRQRREAYFSKKLDVETVKAIFINKDNLSVRERAELYAISKKTVYRIDKGNHWLLDPHALVTEQDLQQIIAMSPSVEAEKEIRL